MAIGTNVWLKRLARSAFWLPVMAAWILTGCGGTRSDMGSPPKTAPEAGVGADVLRPGDRIRIIYNDIPTKIEPAEIQIPDDGIVTLHLGIKVKLAGRHRTEVEAEIVKKYVEEEKFYNRISVAIERIALYVTVGGEVRTPGNVPYVGGMTALKAVIAAGGFTDWALRSEVVVTRTNGEQLTVNLKKAVRNPKLDTPVYPGDQVVVRKRVV